MKAIARRLLLEALARLTAETGPRGLPALTYHSIDESGSAVSFPLAYFRAQIEWLASRGFRGITAAQAAEALAAGEVPPRSVVLTFDDGFATVRETALPVLSECGFVATVFCSAGYVGKPCGWERAPDIPAFDLMPWDDLGFLASQGWEIGAHTMSHARLPELAADGMREEIQQSRRTLTEALGCPVSSFAYPYGGFDDRCSQAVREAGLLSAWTMEPVINRPGRDLFALGRFNCNRVQSDSPRTAALAAQVCLEGRYGAYAALTGRAIRRRRSRSGR